MTVWHYLLTATINDLDQEEVKISWPVPLKSIEELTKAIKDLVEDQEDVHSLVFTVARYAE